MSEREAMLEEKEFIEDPTGTWADAYEELMGEEDEVDVYFILPRPELEAMELDEEDDLFVLRVMGQPDQEMAWVH
jgi:hypothetical protein